MEFHKFSYILFLFNSKYFKLPFQKFIFDHGSFQMCFLVFQCLMIFMMIFLKVFPLLVSNNTIMVRENTLYHLNVCKFIEMCLIAQHIM